jgi:hypothetical protein
MLVGDLAVLLAMLLKIVTYFSVVKAGLTRRPSTSAASIPPRMPVMIIPATAAFQSGHFLPGVNSHGAVKEVTTNL